MYYACAIDRSAAPIVLSSYLLIERFGRGEDCSAESICVRQVGIRSWVYIYDFRGALRLG